MEDAPDINAGFSIAMDAYTKALRAERDGTGSPDDTAAALDAAAEAARQYGPGRRATRLSGSAKR